jgi:hypothetical protein
MRRYALVLIVVTVIIAPLAISRLGYPLTLERPAQAQEESKKEKSKKEKSKKEKSKKEKSKKEKDAQAEEEPIWRRDAASPGAYEPLRQCARRDAAWREASHRGGERRNR